MPKSIRKNIRKQKSIRKNTRKQKSIRKNTRKQKRIKYKFAGDNDGDEKNEDEEEQDENDLAMNKPAIRANGAIDIRNCNNVHIYPKIYLCMCEIFNQYCITFSSGRSRLFTVIGEQHHPILNQKVYLDICKDKYQAEMIDMYIRTIYDHSKNKVVRVFTELSPTKANVERHGSNNLFRLEKANEYFQDKMIYEKIDIREIKAPYFFPFHMYNYKRVRIPDEYTLQNLISEQNENSVWRAHVLPFLNNLITKDGRFKLNIMYEPEHLKILRDFYDIILKEFNSIKGKISSVMILRKKTYQNMNIKLADVINDPFISSIIQMYVNVFAKSLDLYTLIQVFRKDYAADHIMLLVGSFHTKSIDEFLNPFKIFQGKIIEYLPDTKISKLDISGSYY